MLNLKENPVLRYNCGFEVLGKVPSTSTFSRFLDKISSTTYLEEEFTEIVKKAITTQIIDGENIAIDSTQINSYEKAKPTSKLKNDSVSANWGAKRDTNGNTIKWFGYKLHILSDCKSELPMSI
ncbi:MAG: transposase [Sarcina sp.]